MVPVYEVLVPLRTGRGGNDRMHWSSTMAKRRLQREAVEWALPVWRVAPAVKALKAKRRVIVRLTRISPSVTPIDPDNLVASMKATIDGVAARLGVDDGDPRLRFECERAKGPWGVRVALYLEEALTSATIR